MQRRAAIVLVLLACGPTPSSSQQTTTPVTPATDTCRITLAPRSAPLEPLPPPPLPTTPTTPTRPSRMIAHVEMKIASLTKELEAKIAPRIADEKNRDIGIAGRLNYTVDRGPFSVAIENDSLIVRTDIHAHAEACRGGSCYAGCEPQGRATATVPLRLTPDYRWAPSKVAFNFTRGCEVKVLGGMVRIDVTPTIQAQLAPSLHRVEQEIDAKLPPIRPQAERLWAELGKPRPIPLGGCVITNPRGIVEGPVTGTPGALRVRFGLVAYPEIRTRCGGGDALAASAAAAPLPPLAQDPKLPPEDDLLVALVGPAALAVSQTEGAALVDAAGNKTQVRIAHAPAVAGQSAIQIDLGLRGDACGDVGVRSPLAWTEDGKALRLFTPALATPSEATRMQAAAFGQEHLMRALSVVRFPAPVDPDGLGAMLPTIASSMSDASMEVNVKVTSVKPADVTLRGENVVASVLLRGSVDLKQR